MKLIKNFMCNSQKNSDFCNVGTFYVCFLQVDRFVIKFKAMRELMFNQFLGSFFIIHSIVHPILRSLQLDKKCFHYILSFKYINKVLEKRFMFEKNSSEIMLLY